MAYRFRKQEIEDMKNSILFHCECERKHEGKYSAWRLGLILRGEWRCVNNKRESDRLYRKWVLYEALTSNDRPKWEGSGE